MKNITKGGILIILLITISLGSYATYLDNYQINAPVINATSNMTSPEYIIPNGIVTALVKKQFEDYCPFLFKDLPAPFGVLDYSGMCFNTTNSQVEVIIATTPRISLDPNAGIELTDFANSINKYDTIESAVRENKLELDNGIWNFYSDTGSGERAIGQYDGLGWILYDTLGSYNFATTDGGIYSYLGQNFYQSTFQVDSCTHYGSTNWGNICPESENLTIGLNQTGYIKTLNQSMFLDNSTFNKNIKALNNTLENCVWTGNATTGTTCPSDQIMSGYNISNQQIRCCEI